jgi:O-antigen/teichoic acid export membrane protein
VSVALLKNTAWGVLGEFAVRGAKIAQVILIARLLGAHELGRFNYALSLAGLFSVMFDFGIITVAVRELALRPLGSALRLYGRVKLLSSTVGIALIGGAAAFAEISPADAYTALGLGLYLALNDLSTFVVVAYRVKGEFWRETAWRTASAVLQLVACVGALLLAQSVEAVVMALVAVSAVALFPLLQEWIRQPAVTGSHAGWRGLAAAFKHCAPLAGTVLAGSIYMNFDIVVLARHVPMEQVGWYSVAVKAIFAMLIMPLHYFQLASLPAFASELGSTPGSQTRDRWMHGFVLSTTAGCVLCLCTALLAGPLLNLLFGASLSAAAPVLVVFTLIGFTFYLYTPLSQWLLLHGQQRFTLYIQWAATAVNLVAVSLFIPRWGIWGAVAAALATHFTIALAHGALVFGRGDFAANRDDLLALSRLAAGMLTAVVSLHLQIGGPVISKALAIGVFAALTQREFIALARYLLKLNRKLPLPQS